MDNLDKKIDDIIEQAAGIKTVKANPYLYSKVMAKMENKNSTISFLKIKGRLAGVATAVILLNAISIYKVIKFKNTSTLKITQSAFIEIAKEYQIGEYEYLNIQ